LSDNLTQALAVKKAPEVDVMRDELGCASRHERKDEVVPAAEDALLLGAMHPEESPDGAERAGLLGRDDAQKAEDFSNEKDAENQAAFAAHTAVQSDNAFGLNQIQNDAAAVQGATDTGKKAERKLFEGEQPVISVIDARNAGVKADKETLSAKFEGNHAELSLSLPGADKQPLAGNAASPLGAESRFASMLSQELKNNAAEFVKTGSIILKDNDSGSIRLLLNPKDLGDVKIHLQLTDTLIDARISVTTKEAFEAFKSSIDSLKQAFNDSGFSTGEFNLSWSGGGAESGEQGQQMKQAFNTAAAEYAAAVPDYDETTEKSIIESGNYAVNIMA
jgi:flagellar hook-length control protein FliK